VMSQRHNDSYGSQSGQAAPIDRFSFVDGIDRKLFRLRSRRTMIELSHVIEEQATVGGAETVLIAAFQRLSLYAVEAERYRQFAPQFAQMYVLGVPDVVVPEAPNITIMLLDRDWPLVQEWSVIACGPQVAVGLLAVDAEGFRPDKRSRSFEGLFTTDSALIDAAVARFHTALDLPWRATQRDHRATSRNTETVRRALAARI